MANSIDIRVHMIQASTENKLRHNTLSVKLLLLLAVVIVCATPLLIFDLHSLSKANADGFILQFVPSSGACTKHSEEGGDDLDGGAEGAEPAVHLGQQVLRPSLPD